MYQYRQQQPHLHPERQLPEKTRPQCFKNPERTASRDCRICSLFDFDSKVGNVLIHKTSQNFVHSTFFIILITIAPCHKMQEVASHDYARQ